MRDKRQKYCIIPLAAQKFLIIPDTPGDRMSNDISLDTSSLELKLLICELITDLKHKKR